MTCYLTIDTEAEPLVALRGLVGGLDVIELESAPVVTVELSNTYADGHASTRLTTLPAPEDDIEQWWEDVVWPETGDGHQGDAHYRARIVRGPGLLTLSQEWLG